jgi:hypothetical protein
MGSVGSAGASRITPGVTRIIPGVTNEESR